MCTSYLMTPAAFYSGWTPLGSRCADCKAEITKENRSADPVGCGWCHYRREQEQSNEI